MKTGAQFWRGFLVAVAAAAVSSACHFDDDYGCHDCDCGHAVTRSFDIAGFDEVVVRDAFRVTVREASAYRVTVTTSRAAEDRVDVRRDGARLTIGTNGGWGVWGGCGERSAVVELPRLRRVSAEQASRIRLEGISAAPAVDLSASAASRLEGNLDVRQANLRVSEASEAAVTGNADQLELEASGVSRASLGDLATRHADVEARNASNVTVRVSDLLDVTATAASVVRYIGQPQLGRVDISGGARLEHER